MGRQGRVGGPPPQGPVPVLAGLMDGNGCSIGTHILSYKPQFWTAASFPIVYGQNKQPLSHESDKGRSKYAG